MPGPSGDEECHEFGDVFWRGDFTQRQFGDRLVVDLPGCKSGVHPSRSDRIGEDTGMTEAPGDALGQAQQSPFGSTIGEMLCIVTAMSRTARDVDDRATAEVGEIKERTCTGPPQR